MIPFDQRATTAAIFIFTHLAVAIGKLPVLRLDRTGAALLGAAGGAEAAGKKETRR